MIRFIAILWILLFAEISNCQIISNIEKRADSLYKCRFFDEADRLYNKVLGSQKITHIDSVRIFTEKANIYYMIDDTIQLYNTFKLLVNLKETHPDIKNDWHWSSYISLIGVKYFHLFNNYDSIGRYADDAIRYRINHKKDSLLAVMLSFKGYAFQKNNDYSKCNIYNYLSLRYFMKNKIFDKTIIRTILSISFYYWKQNEFDKYKQILEIALRIIEVNKINDSSSADVNLYLGLYYLQFSDYFNAYKCFSKMHNYNLNERERYLSYYYLAFAYNTLGDYSLANKYYKIIYSKKNLLDETIIKDLNFYYASSLNNLKNYDSSIVYLTKFIKSYNVNQNLKLEHAHHLLASNYYRINNNDSALKYVNIALNEYERKKIEDREYVKSLVLKGQILNNSDSESLYEKAQRIIKKNCGIKNSRTSQIYKETGIARAKNKLYKKALTDFQQSLICNDLDFYSTNIFDNPGCKRVLTFVCLAKVLSNKYEILEKVYHETDSLQYLIASYETSKLLIEQIEKMMKSYPMFESKQFLIENSQQSYSNAQRLGYLCWLKTKKTKYKEENIEIAEKSRASILNAEMQEKEHVSVEINDSLKQNLKNIEQQIAYVTWQINEYSNSEKESIIEKLKIELFDLQEQKNKLTESSKGEYGNYSSCFNENAAMSFHELLNFPKENEAILEYSICDSIIILNLILKGQHEIVEIKYDSMLAQNIQKYKLLLVPDNFDYSKINLLADINNIGEYMYQRFIDPVKNYINDKELIIIQDTKLDFIPFESFIVDGKYLIEKQPISYMYSINVTHENNTNVHPKKKNRMAAFFPEYETDKQNQSQPSFKYYKSLPLLENKNESELLSNIVYCDTFISQNATEENFKKYASNYSILHLSLHSILSTENYLLSKLCFTPVSDSINDGLFNLCDIEPLKLNSDLLVLSGCNTGSGEIITGEGVMSFARSFILAGSHSILMSLWDLDNSSSEAISIGFYKYLKEGFNKSEALQLSKIDYLKTADKVHRHPNIWSGFVLIGDNSKIEMPNRYSISEKIALIFTIAIILTLIYFRKKRKAKSIK